MLAIGCALLSFLSLIISVLCIIKNKQPLSIIFALCTSGFAVLSAYLLHLLLIESGKVSSILGAVYGPWGQERIIVPTVYSIAMISGILIAVYSYRKMSITSK